METTQLLAMLIFLCPVAAFAVLALLHNKLPRHGDWFGIGVLVACWVMALTLFARMWQSEVPVMVNVVFDWLPVAGHSTLSGGIMVDALTSVMLVVVTTVSMLVHLFSSKYMEGDVRYGRYYCGLMIFTASMLGLVLANNLLYLFVFWELVGLSSYLLIGHWFEKKSASNAAIKAFITTRVGDVGMFIGLMICYSKVGSLQYADLFAAVANGTLAGAWQTWAGLGIFFGAMGKSAQFPLHVWLPDAMEGPTPVSALIHAATMVAAGVYLTGRLLPLFDATTLLVIAYVGGFTALFAATIALVQDDIKKVLAYSTVSQLGYMILALGVGGYVSGLFHLTTHAFFKAGLFLGSGAVIHAMHHEQSMKQYGGLFKKMPITATCYLLATLALCGFPGFSGFFSKDAILADSLAFSMTHHGHWFLPFAGFFTAFLTAFYMFRQYLLTFAGKPRNQKKYDHAHEVPWQMWLPLVVLGALALAGGWGGWFGKLAPKRDGVAQIEAFAQAGYTSEAVEHALGAAATHETHAAHEHMTHETPAHDAAPAEHGEAAHGGHDAAHRAHGIAMVLSIILALSGIAMGFAFYWERSNGKSLLDPARPATMFAPIYKLLWNKYYVDELYDAVLLAPVHLKARFFARFDRMVIDSIVNAFGTITRLLGVIVSGLDRLLVDGGLVMGTARTTNLAGRALALFQTGRVRQYFVMTILGLILISVLWVWTN